MKIIKEDIENLERYIGNAKVGVHTDLPIVMADAYEDSKKRQEEIDKELKDTTKIPEPEKVIGAEKQPVPKLPEEAKVNLEESLFEDYDSDVRHYSDMLFDMIEEDVVDAKQIAQSLIYWCSEDDIERFMEVNELIWDEDEEEVEESLKKKNKNLKEARGRKASPFVDSQGNSFGDEDRGEGFDEISEDDLFNIVSAELCPEDSNWYRKTKIPEIPQWRRYNYENMGSDGEGNIFVRTKSEDELKLAKRVAEVYGLQTSGPYKTGTGYKFTLIIPE